MFLDCSAALPECRFSIPAPEFHRSVAELISSLSHTPFGRSFSFQFAPQLVGSEKGLKLTPSAKLFERRLYDKKGRYTAHQISGRKSLAISLMKLCTGSAIQKPSMSAFSAPPADSVTGAVQPQSLSAAALSFIQIFSCGSPMRAYKLYYAEHLFVKRFWHTAAEKRLPFPTAALGLII